MLQGSESDAKILRWKSQNQNKIDALFAQFQEVRFVMVDLDNTNEIVVVVGLEKIPDGFPSHIDGKRVQTVQARIEMI
jgi:hypothetical protein